MSNVKLYKENANISDLYESVKQRSSVPSLTNFILENNNFSFYEKSMLKDKLQDLLNNPTIDEDVKKHTLAYIVEKFKESVIEINVVDSLIEEGIRSWFGGNKDNTVRLGSARSFINKLKSFADEIVSLRTRLSNVPLLKEFRGLRGDLNRTLPNNTLTGHDYTSPQVNSWLRSIEMLKSELNNPQSPVMVMYAEIKALAEGKVPSDSSQATYVDAEIVTDPAKAKALNAPKATSSAIVPGSSSKPDASGAIVPSRGIPTTQVSSSTEQPSRPRLTNRGIQSV